MWALEVYYFNGSDQFLDGHAKQVVHDQESTYLFKKFKNIF